MTRRRGRRRRKLLDDFKDRRGYSHLKEETLDRTMWRHRFGGGFGPVVRQNTEWMPQHYCKKCWLIRSKTSPFAVISQGRVKRRTLMSSNRCFPHKSTFIRRVMRESYFHYEKYDILLCCVWLELCVSSTVGLS